MLHQDCEKLDPRIRRTRHLLQDALKGLLEAKEFDKITIQDIAEAATLNRATFYAHYPDKFALLEELIRVNFLQLPELQKSRASKQRQFEAFVEGTVIDQIRIILMDGYKKHPAEGTNNPELIAATASWAIYGAAKQWVNTPERVPAEEFVASSVNMVGLILAA